MFKQPLLCFVFTILFTSSAYAQFKEFKNVSASIKKNDNWSEVEKIKLSMRVGGEAVGGEGAEGREGGGPAATPRKLGKALPRGVLRREEAPATPNPAT